MEVPNKPLFKKETIIKYSFLGLLLCLSVSSYGQLFVERHEIGNINTPRIISSADLDGDGDMDALTSSFDFISWYENTDGLGNFGSAQAVAMGTQQSFSHQAADIDGDGDMDVVATSFDQHTVFWNENLDGQGNFGAMQIIDNTLLGAVKVRAGDLDGDGDLDVIAASDSNRELYWYENIDGAGVFGTGQLISSTGVNSRGLFIGDMDGDLDNDIVAASAGSITISWFENLDGLGSFSTVNVIAGAALSVNSVYGADLDGDIDLDIVACTNAEDIVAWHENLDGQGNFGSQQVITNQADVAINVFAIDLDNDNDVDVLSASAGDNTIAWYENLDGSGNFSVLKVIDDTVTNCRTVFAADIDGDGDQDVLAASLTDGDLYWYENGTILNSEEFSIPSLKLYPSPVESSLFIESKVPVLNVTVHDLSGKKVLETPLINDQINLSALSSGLWLVVVQTEQGAVVKKVVKE